MSEERLYSLLLLLYPNSFRRRFGADMIDTCRDLRRTTRLSPLHFWTFIAADSCRAAMRQHVDEWKTDLTSPTVRWIVSCVVGAIAAEATGNTLVWLFDYLYHPYLEGVELFPWVYGAIVGSGLGMVQCRVLRRIRPAIWIGISTVSAAVAFESAASLTSTRLLPYVLVVGVIVGAGQWLVLRRRVRFAGMLALISATGLSAGGFLRLRPLVQVFAGLNPLNEGPPVFHANRAMGILMRTLSAPTTIDQWTLGIAAMAIVGLVVGAVTAKPIESLWSEPN